MLLNENNLAQLLQLQASQFPQKIAYTFLLDGESLEQHISYAELEQRAIYIASELQQRGIEKGERALLLYSPGIELLAAFYGCLYAGIIAVLTYPPQNKELATKLHRIIENAHPVLYLTSKKLNEQIQKSLVENFFEENTFLLNQANCFVTDNLSEQLPTSWQPVNIPSDHLAFLQYTSGSTGNPKGVMISHSNILHNLKILQKHCGVNQNSQIISWLPPYHDMGLIGGILLSLYCGCVTRFMSPLSFLQRPIRWLRAISHYRATTSVAPNFAYDLCVSKISDQEKSTLDLNSWQLTINGAEPIRATTLKRFTEAFESCGFRSSVFYPSYGLAEGTLISTGGKLSDEPIIQSVLTTSLQKEKIIYATNSSGNSQQLVGSGECVDDQELIIVNPKTLTRSQENEIGEIWMAGPSIAQGYWQQPTLTQEIFHAYLKTGEGPFLRTGDLGFLKDRELFVTGRLKDLIIIFGKNHFPQDIELTSEESHPALRKNCCVAFSIEKNEQEQLVIIQGVKPGHQNIAAEITTHIREQIVKQHGINPYVIALTIKSLPKTTSGKIRRQYCRQLYLENQLPLLFSDTLELTNNSPKDFSLTPQEQLLQQLSHLTHQPFLKPNHTLSQLGINSLTLVELQYILTEQFNKNISMEFLLSDPSVDSLLKLISTDENKIEISEKNINFDLEFNHHKLSSNTTGFSSPRKENILLTGATGFLGAYLLKELLLNTSSTVYCLVKACEKEQGFLRVKNNLLAYELWEEIYADRIQIILGDLTQKNLGLGETTYQQLASQIDSIYHNGAALNFVYSYHQLKAANVFGTQQILSFATQQKIKSIHYVSTIGYFLSADLSSDTIINEELELSEQHGIYGGYNQTKWLAEKLVKHAQSLGISTTIYRPGLIAGDSKKGHWNSNDFVCRMLKGCAQLFAIPQLNAELDLVPVDYVAKAIAHLSLDENSFGKTYHLVNPQPISFDRFSHYFSDHQKNIQKVNYQEWKKLLLNELSFKRSHVLYPLLPFFIEKRFKKNLSMFELYMQPQRPRINCDATAIKLKEIGIECSPMDHSLVTKYLDHLFQ